MGFLQKSAEESAPKNISMHVQVIQYIGAGDDDVQIYWGLLG